MIPWVMLIVNIPATTNMKIFLCHFTSCYVPSLSPPTFLLKGLHSINKKKEIKVWTSEVKVNSVVYHMTSYSSPATTEARPTNCQTFHMFYVLHTWVYTGINIFITTYTFLNPSLIHEILYLRIFMLFNSSDYHCMAAATFNICPTDEFRYFHCFFLFFGGPGVCTQSLALAKQVLYHLSHTSRAFCSGYFEDGVSMNYLPGVALNWWSSPSQSPKYLGLQAWANSI
jgi:hypothetical protein